MAIGGIDNAFSGAGGLSSILGSSSSVSGLIQGASGDSGAIISSLQTSTNNTVQQQIDRQNIQQQKNNILNTAATRLEYIRQGRLEPTAEWEKVGSYFAQTGQPFVLTIDKKGAINAVAQNDPTYDGSRYGPGELKKLQAASGELADVFAKQDANDQNQKLIDKLTGATVLLDALSIGVPPASRWEQEAQALQTTKTPFRLNLDSQGNIIVQDQTKTNFYENYPPQQAETLTKAASTIRTALQTGVGYSPNLTPGLSWQSDANERAATNQNYYLDVDPVYNNIVVKYNQPNNVIPSFLKEPPYSDVGANSKWKQDAIELKKAGKGFHLDIDNTGNVAVKENTATNTIRYNQERYPSTSNTGALLSLLA